ncbi:MAG: hypothetical protein PHV39_02600 [Methanomicrobium sp.]|nr:hypothetical protein [Methanomicrobium sp.]
MSKVNFAKSVSSILEDTTTSAAKKLGDIGDIIKNNADIYKTTTDTKTAAINIAKWGAVPAAAGVGGAVGLAALGAGVDNALGTTTENASKLGGWLMLIGISAVVILVFLPKIRAATK